VTANGAFTITRNNFNEFVRIRLDGNRFSVKPGKLEGSRIANFRSWHYVDYLRRDATGRWTADTSGKIPAASAARGNAGNIGNGGVVIKVLTKAVNEGFTLSYALPAREWTLTGTSGDTEKVAVAAAPAGTQWAIKLGDKVKVTLTQGATAFETGDKFTFSMFVAKSAAGKVHVVSLGSTAVKDEE